MAVSHTLHFAPDSFNRSVRQSFDTEGKEIATKSLPYRGATDVAEALCGPLKSRDAD